MVCNWGFDFFQLVLFPGDSSRLFCVVCSFLLDIPYLFNHSPVGIWADSILFMDICCADFVWCKFSLPWDKCPRVHLLGCIVIYKFSSARNCWIIFQCGGTTLCSHPVMYEGSTFSASSPGFGFVTLRIFSHPDSCVALSHGSFNLHFPNS